MENLTKCQQIFLRALAWLSICLVDYGLYLAWEPLAWGFAGFMVFIMAVARYNRWDDEGKERLKRLRNREGSSLAN